MTSISEHEGFSLAGVSSRSGAVRPTYSLDETYWGYIIRAREPLRPGVLVAQWVSWLFGAAFAVAALGLWVLPQAMLTGEGIGLKIGASTVMAGAAMLLFWYSSRGTEAELQIDTSLGEIREVTRNRAGRPTLLARYGFDSIGGVHVDRSGSRPRLVMRYGNTAQMVPVCAGSEEDLALLRNRLGRDVVLNAPRRAELRKPDAA